MFGVKKSIFNFRRPINIFLMLEVEEILQFVNTKKKHFQVKKYFQSTNYLHCVPWHLFVYFEAQIWFKS